MYLLFFSFSHDLVNSLLSLVSFVLQKDKENVLDQKISIMLQKYYHSKIFKKRTKVSKLFSDT
jgi:hypothetical protein